MEMVIHEHIGYLRHVSTDIMRMHMDPELLRLCYCRVLRAGAPPAMLWRTRVLVTRSEATVERWMGAARTTRRSSRRRSGPNRQRAGAGGPEGGSGPTTSIRNAGGAFTNRMTAETLCVRADIACVIYICTLAVTTTQKWY
jgi:hypothetical protein